MNIDTALYIAAVFGLLCLFVFLTVDYWKARNGQTTASKVARSFWVRNQCRPHVWVAVGGIAVGAVLLVVGFVLGHLFWPQFVRGQ